MQATKQQLLDLADKWAEAGASQVDMERSDFDLLGIEWPDLKTSNTWEKFCDYAHRKLTGNPHPGSGYRGTGSRSREYGEIMAALIRGLAEQV